MAQPDFRAKVVLEASVSPSEDPAKVVHALRNVVGDAQAEVGVEGKGARLTTDDHLALVRVRDQLRDRHVRSAARRQMLLNAKGRSTTLMLNRQAATGGIVAVCGSPEESPLGPIYMRIESENLDGIIEWLAATPGSQPQG